MSRQKSLTRRDVLGILGKTGVSLSSANLIFLSLRTYSLDDVSLDRADWDDQVRPPQVKRRQPLKPARPGKAEKVLISGSGSALIFKVSGLPGRHCAVAFARADKPEHYKPFLRSKSVIAGNGTVIIRLNVKNLPDQKAFFRVVTGATRNFSRGLRGTRAFEVIIAGGKVSQLVGLKERPLGDAQAVASAAVACYGAKSP